MTIEPNVQFHFSPTCSSFVCCCCSGHDDESTLYCNSKGKFKPVHSLSDKEVLKANERFRAIIERKLDPLPLDTKEFIDRLENEEGISLKVSREFPLTKERLDKTVKAINRILGNMHVD